MFHIGYASVTTYTNMFVLFQDLTDTNTSSVRTRLTNTTQMMKTVSVSNFYLKSIELLVNKIKF